MKNSTAQRYLTKKQFEEKKIFCKVADEWYLKNQFHWKDSTKLKYENILKIYLFPEFSDLDIREINDVKICNYIYGLMRNDSLNEKKHLSVSTVKTLWTVINSILNFGYEHNYNSKVISKIQFPRNKKKEIAVMSRLNQIKLEKGIIEDMTLTGLGVLIALNTGLRIGEICALKWDDIDFSQRILTVKHTIIRAKNNNYGFQSKQKTILKLDTPKTISSQRSIPVSTRLCPVLLSAKKISVSDFVISDKKSFVSPRTFEHRFHQLLKKQGIPDTNFHVLRHTFATRCIEMNVDIKTLSLILGHADINITLNTYVHSSLESMRCQLEKLNDLYN